tara:strand:+ start:43 stop:270 length:228 start_codon:yes stop_codon:yes gene_type:complete
MSVNDMSKGEIVDHLQVAEYYRDELRQTLEKIKTLFNISFDVNEMNEAGWNEDNDEMFGDMLFCELNKIHKNNFK